MALGQPSKRQGEVLRTLGLLLSGLCTVLGCHAPDSQVDRPFLPSPIDAAVVASRETPVAATVAKLPAVPVSQPADRPLPINLPAALQLANVRAVDVEAASERIQAAAAVLEKARALWLPTVSIGADYYYHTGPIQDVSNTIFNDSHSAFMVGAGGGIGPAAVLTVADAIFAPLVARQQVRARQADIQTASNDALVAVSDAYFTVQQARGELAGAVEAARRTEELVRRTKKLAPAIVPELELFRAETELARREEAEFLARERWKVASAELLRLLRMDPSAQVDPVEPPHLRVELIDLNKPVDDLIAIGLMHRPELASQKAQIEATLASIKQERWRPFLPNVLVRGASTNPSGTLAAGAFFPSPSDGISGMRADVDVQLLWQLDNLGFGNRATIHQKEAENRLAVVELSRMQYQVASEVAKAHAQAQQAGRRAEAAERGLRSAVLSAEKNLDALQQTKALGNQLVTLVRPQEVVAAIQALSQAYLDYYGAVNDANRAQFRLYRALGQPAQHVVHDGRIAPSSNPIPPVVAPMAVPAAPEAPANPAPSASSAPPATPAVEVPNRPAVSFGAPTFDVPSPPPARQD